MPRTTGSCSARPRPVDPDCSSLDLDEDRKLRHCVFLCVATLAPGTTSTSPPAPERRWPKRSPGAAPPSSATCRHCLRFGNLDHKFVALDAPFAGFGASRLGRADCRRSGPAGRQSAVSRRTRFWNSDALRGRLRVHLQPRFSAAACERDLQLGGFSHQVRRRGRAHDHALRRAGSGDDARSIAAAGSAADSCRGFPCAPSRGERRNLARTSLCDT